MLLSLVDWSYGSICLFFTCFCSYHKYELFFLRLFLVQYCAHFFLSQWTSAYYLRSGKFYNELIIKKEKKSVRTADIGCLFWNFC